MTDAQRKAHTFLMGQHRQSCFEQGDHPDETDTPYSIGADAIARPMTVAEAAKVLRDNTPNPTFDILKYSMIGEFKQSIAMQDEDGEEVWRDVTIEWTTIKEIFAAGLRALSQGGE
ncbi:MULTISPECIES: hypothetical protein [unclassified Sulfitobacter]|uniref:hypothetical protein n=1 Tax=Sulfitobacter phage pCB2047-C TaxID=754043 RepID=UPI0002C08A77|nr:MULTISPECIES: hypothetical protein [unclassified Sulfitobacter]YP_007675279.1 hypothetical protein SUBG_00022 [Sulfitobacter phage pCB2047-C]YP_007675451.1 hypothetical protein SUAG_00059 [Sulfitobacter phage pCB2047-A]YP_009146181.1 hypothetical protein SUFP_007 [Sulfitobacter phage NYA-2014a]AGG91192.1 hypothetical protein SUBG_00022 [Sulfitobacter phage pCB2047-C]AGH30785.1 hypothetical protein SUAG_00059 [Sulfitobacter phage pCB2047-A]AIM40638.1 hypothetical protein SUFP_007 [Sulfitoba